MFSGQFVKLKNDLFRVHWVLLSTEKKQSKFQAFSVAYIHNKFQWYRTVIGKKMVWRFIYTERKPMLFFDLFCCSMWTLNWIVYEPIWKRCRSCFRFSVKEPLWLFCCPNINSNWCGAGTSVVNYSKIAHKEQTWSNLWRAQKHSPILRLATAIPMRSSLISLSVSSVLCSSMASSYSPVTKLIVKIYEQLSGKAVNQLEWKEAVVCVVGRTTGVRLTTYSALHEANKFSFTNKKGGQMPSLFMIFGHFPFTWIVLV